MELAMQKCDPVKSVYADDGKVEVLGATTDGIFVYQTESVDAYDAVTEMHCVYTPSGDYVGTKTDADYLLSRGITENIQPHSTGKTCSIGFNPTEQKWYGWSHRAIFGFGIGSQVKFGDCAYTQTDKKDVERSAMGFWDVGVVCDLGEGNECYRKVLLCEHDAKHEGFKGLGLLIELETSFNTDRAPYTMRHFHEYPEVWGRGEWTARTMADAKQMAIDFAEGVD